MAVLHIPYIVLSVKIFYVVAYCKLLIQLRQFGIQHNYKFPRNK